MRTRSFSAGVVILALLIPATAGAERDFSAVEIQAIHVAGPVHYLEGAGGNIGVSVGADGFLLVDDQFAPLGDKIRAALAKLGEGKPAFVLNTHWHGDHTDGNKVFGLDATIVAHDNVRRRLAGDASVEGKVAADTPAHALPVITFDQSLSIHFNGETIEMIHFPRGHTDGDAVVFFTGSKVVHMGDTYFGAKFPFVDLASGGDVVSLTANIKHVIARLPADAKVVCGHAPVGVVADLRIYVEMLEATTAAVRAARDAGKSLDAIQATGVGERYADWSWDFISADKWLETVYESLAR